MTHSFENQYLNAIKFSKREIAVIACIVNGRTSRKSIALTLNIAPSTVATYISNIMQKLNCSSWEKIRDFAASSPEINILHQEFNHLTGHHVQDISKDPIIERTKKNIYVIETSQYLKMLLPHKNKIILSCVFIIILTTAYHLIYSNDDKAVIQSDLYLPPETIMLKRASLQKKVSAICDPYYYIKRYRWFW